MKSSYCIIFQSFNLYSPKSSKRCSFKFWGDITRCRRFVKRPRDFLDKDGLFWRKKKTTQKRCRILTPTVNVGNGKCWQFSRSGRKRSHNFKSNSFGDLYRKTREIGCFLKNALGWWEIFREFFSRFFGYHRKPLVEDPSALNNEDQGATEV